MDSYTPLYHLFIVLIACVVFVIKLCFFWKGDTARRRRPPGPGWALPIVGNLFQLGSNPHLTCLKWKKKYGSLVYFKMGTQPVVLINNARLMKEMLASPVVRGRPNSEMINIMTCGYRGVWFSEGQNWEEQRSHVVHTLNELGRGGNVEKVLLDETKSLLTYLEARVGLPTQGGRCFKELVISGLWKILSGQGFEWCQGGELKDTPISVQCFEMTESMKVAAKNGLMSFPWLRFVAPERLGWNRFVRSSSSFLNFLEETVKEHATTLNSNYPSDLIDHFLNRIQATEDPSSTFYGNTGRLNLRVGLADLLITSSVSTCTLLEFAMLYICHHPEVQERLQEELDQVLGHCRYPTLGDRGSLPYTQAVLLETLRLSATVAKGPFRFTKDFEFQGYLLPKDTSLLLDIYSILHDPDDWDPDSNVFRPDRFLNENMEVDTPCEFLPFGTGKRDCFGKSLAEDTFFLVVTSIFQKFSIELVPEGAKVDYNDSVSGMAIFTVEPKPFEMRVNLRRA